MSRCKLTIIIVILIALTGVAARAIDKNSYIGATRSYYKEAYQDIKPAAVVSAWMVPFDTHNRYDIRSIRVVSVFGDHRESYLKGHIHTATDLIPAHKSGMIYIFIRWRKALFAPFTSVTRTKRLLSGICWQTVKQYSHRTSTCRKYT